MGEALPETSFYLEVDYSNQMVADLLVGALDLAILFSPSPSGDLIAEPIGDVRYRMISAEADRLSAVRRETYVRAPVSPRLGAIHAERLPELQSAALAFGHSGAVVEFLETTYGWGGYCGDVCGLFGVYCFFVYWLRYISNCFFYVASIIFSLVLFVKLTLNDWSLFKIQHKKNRRKIFIA